MGETIVSAALISVLDALAVGDPVIMTGARDGGPIMVQAADAVDADAVNFMAREARGLLGIAIRPGRAAAFGLSLQPRRHNVRPVPLYTMSIEAALGTTTGISAGERATTIAAASATPPIPERVISPGHVFPQISVAGSRGQAEGALALLQLAGCVPVAMVCSILDKQGGEADMVTACQLAETLGLYLVDIDEPGLLD